MYSYADIVAILSYAPHCSDVAQAALAQLDVAASAARLAEHSAWACLVGELVAVGVST